MNEKEIDIYFKIWKNKKGNRQILSKSGSRNPSWIQRGPSICAGSFWQGVSTSAKLFLITHLIIIKIMVMMIMVVVVNVMMLMVIMRMTMMLLMMLVSTYAKLFPITHLSLLTHLEQKKSQKSYDWSPFTRLISL